MSRFLIDRPSMSSLWIICLVIPVFSCTQEADSNEVLVHEVKEEIVEPQDIPTYHIDDLLGRFEPREHPDFKEIPSSYASRSGMFLRKEALEAFQKMADKAKEDGVQLTIISATRNFARQKTIWEGKWNGSRKQNGRDLKTEFQDERERALEILKYSSMPGTSRHHWGTDIDINSLNNSYFESGKGKTEYEWLRENGFEYGFCQVYSEKDEGRPNGYEEEKWHWSFVTLASSMTKAYEAQIDSTSFGGFDGDDALGFEESLNYVLGIAHECQ